MILEFSSEAENDLEQTADYIAQDDPLRALSFVRELRSKCERLLAAPNSFSLLQTASPSSPGSSTMVSVGEFMATT